MKSRHTTTMHFVREGSSNADTPTRSSMRPVPDRDDADRDMFAKLHRNPEFSIDSVHQAFTKALASKIG
jgi:hypothetical protein